MTYLVTLNNGIVFLGEKRFWDKFLKRAKFTVLASKILPEGTSLTIPQESIMNIIKDGREYQQ